MKRSLSISLCIVGMLSANVFAHKLWVRPSQTQFSGNDAWATFDTCASNDLFYFNHVPLPLNNLSIVGPDGQKCEAANQATGKYRSVFDLELKHDGTYRVAVITGFIFANWVENGETKRWRGIQDNFSRDVPQNAENLKVMESMGRIETFVTKNAPNTTAFAPIGKGMELIPVTHPNDLIVSEKATFRILVDGQPRPGLDVSVIRGETRYRNNLDESTLTTNAAGEFTVSWPEPGMYWLSASTSDNNTTLPRAQSRGLTYAATFEVLPE